MEKQYITKAGYEKVAAELEEWKTVKRPAMVAQLAAARSHGDLSENAEYHAAKEDLGRIDYKIFQLETLLRNSILVDEANVNTDQVRLFTRVKIKDRSKNNAEREYALVSPTEANPVEGKINHLSPVGKGLIGAKVGEVVEIQIPAGTVLWEILEILPYQQ